MEPVAKPTMGSLHGIGSDRARHGCDGDNGDDYGSDCLLELGQEERIVF